MDAYLVAWNCARYNKLSQHDSIASRLSGSALICSREPERFHEWFATLDRRDSRIVDVTLDSVRTTLFKRHIHGQVLMDVLWFWDTISYHPSIMQRTKHMASQRNSPVLWIIKAVQRQLCAYPEDEKYEEDTIPLGMAGIVCVADSS